MPHSVTNIHPISKVDNHTNGYELWVREIFSSIQGEGPFSGHPATFIRFGGCNLNCQYCDTDYSLEKSRHLSIDEILFCINLHAKSHLIVVTGGEPFRQNLLPLFELLHDAGYTIQVETNGTLPAPTSKTIQWNSKGYPLGEHFIVCSPKTTKLHGGVITNIHSYKYVIQCGNVNHCDGLPIRCVGNPVKADDKSAQVSRPPRWWKGDIYITPLDEKLEINNKNNLQLAVVCSLEFGHILQVQLQKIAGIL